MTRADAKTDEEKYQPVRIYLSPKQLTWLEKQTALTGENKSLVFQRMIDRQLKKSDRLGGLTELEKFLSFLKKNPDIDQGPSLSAALQAFFSHLEGKKSVIKT